MKRMDRYRDESDDTRVSRSDNNKELYESIGSNTRYTSFTDVTNANAIDLSSKKNSNRREGYHQMKEYQDVIPTTRTRKDLDEFKSIYHSHENKVYDINNVLEEARKNRLEKDALEEKRKLKNTSYNILASLNPEELEKYRKEKKEKPIRADDEDLRELIDTIASATLAGDIKAASELLGDLMATSIMDKVEAQAIEDDEDEDKDLTSTTELPRATDDDDDEDVEEEKEEEDDSKKELSYKEALEKEKLDLQELKKLTSKKEDSVVEETQDDIMASADDDFYTRSMDLSAHDFDFDDDFKEKKMPFGIKLLIFLIILVVLAAVFYFLWQNI